MIPVIFIKTLVEQLRGYIESHGISAPFVCFNVITMIMYPFAGWYFIWKHQYGLTSVVIIKVIYGNFLIPFAHSIIEIFNLMVCYSVLRQG
jgi:hypothetical protein